MEPLDITAFLFSGVFVLIGSLAFHISALISGHNIYRDFSEIESTWLSMVAGIVIFLLSPISFIIFSASTVDCADISVQILDFDVLFAFFGCAVGLGLVFGSLTIVKVRVNVLEWFRDKSGMRFWIYSYGVAWDDLLLSVKRHGEVFVQTDENGKEFKGSLKHFSIRNEPKEMVLYNAKCIGTNGIEEDIWGEGGANLWIDGSKIKKIIIPEGSFKKHFDSMGHISQAFYCIIASIGFCFLSYSAHLTENYLETLGIFYHTLSLSFLVLTIFVLCVSVWVAKKDFDNWRSFLVLSPTIVFVALFFSLLSILLIIFDMERSQVLILVFAVLCIHLYRPFCIKRSNSLEKRVEPEKPFWELLQESGLAVFFCVLLIIVLGFILFTQRSQVSVFLYDFFSILSGFFSCLVAQLSPVVIFIFVSSLLYLIISDCLKEPIKKRFNGIKNTFTDDEKLLEVIQKFYLRLSCNGMEKTHINDVEGAILAECKNCVERGKIREMVNKLNDLKNKNGYLKNEDFNIILAFRKYIKKS